MRKCCAMTFFVSLTTVLIILIGLNKISLMQNDSKLPLVINTWAFLNATENAWNTLYNERRSALDAVERGCSTCEELQCDGTVGFGGSPDEDGETTLDSMIMNGADLNMGAVAGLRRIKSAASVARSVLEHTQHSILVGDLATKFAVEMGFKEETLQTNYSLNIWKEWLKNNCQPNFWTNVIPNPQKQCGPYNPKNGLVVENDINYNFNIMNHDTIGMIAIDENGNIAAGTSSNGANHKIPGRVGDSPLPGAGAYADNDVGAAVATGDGDIMMRLLPSFLAVEEMRRGSLPTESAQLAIRRIANKYTTFFGAVITVNRFGDYGAACHGMDTFSFGVRNLILGKVTLKTISC